MKERKKVCKEVLEKYKNKSDYTIRFANKKEYH